MKKYVKKPIEIEALQWTGTNHREMFDFLENKPDQHMTAFGDNFRIDHSKVEGGLVIKTLEGEHIASIGDFIIKGIKGEFYPCKPDVFKLTYQDTSHPTSLPSDWTSQCSCNPAGKTGETWCCNTCGKPTPRLSTVLPSDEESRYDVTFGGHVKALISVQNGHLTVIGAVSGYGDSIIEETTVYKQLTTP